jgi:hypothetical protein
LRNERHKTNNPGFLLQRDGTQRYCVFAFMSARGDWEIVEPLGAFVNLYSYNNDLAGNSLSSEIS